MIINGREIIARDGYVLTNKEIYCTHLFLGKYDSSSNWQEISIEEVPQDE